MPKKKETKPKKARLDGRIEKVKELPLVVSSLFYGRSGTGKTTLSGTFPGSLILDIGEKGTDSVSDTSADVLKVQDWQDIEDIYWDLVEKRVSYQTVTIDAVHSMQDLAILRVKEQNNKQPEEQTSKRDYGMASSLMKTWIVHFRDLVDLGINVVFLSHERVTSEEAEDDEILNPEIGPRLMPSVASTLCGSVNVVGHTFIRERITKPKKLGSEIKREVSYCLRLGPHGCYTTKIRTPKDRPVPDILVDPTYDKIVSIIKRGEVKPETKGKTVTAKSKRKVRRGK